MQLRGEGLVEIVHHLDPVQLAFFHGVQLVFHGGGEFHVDDVAEVFLHQVHHQAAQLRGIEQLVFPHHVGAGQDGVDDGSVGGGAADAQFFHGLDQRGLAVARRRLGEVLLTAQLFQIQHLALLHRGDHAVVLFFLFGGFVLALAVDLGIAGEAHYLAGGPEEAVVRFHVDSGHVQLRRGHLGGHEAVPDQLIQLILLGGEEGLEHSRGPFHRGWADGFVSVLDVGLALAGRMDVGGLRRVGRAVFIADVFQGLLLGFLIDTHRIGTHIGNEAGVDPAYGEAFVQLLGGLHGLLGHHAQALGSLLLQGGGGEGRRRRLFARAYRHRFHAIGRFFQLFHQLIHRILIAQMRFFVVDLDQPHQKLIRTGLEGGVKIPVFLGLEGVDLLFPVADQTHGHRLHAARGQALFHLFPQQGADLVAHHPVQDAPGLLGLDLIQVDLGRVGHGGLDGGVRDLVEADAAVAVGQLQILLQMPGDGFPFPVRVGAQQDAVGLAGFVPQGLDDVALAADGDVMGRVVVVEIHAHGALGQVANMAHAGLDHVITAQEAFDGLGFGR